jgi:serine protease Do
VRADGLILTNAHVVSKRGQVATDLSVQLADGRELPARVLAMEPQSDLALLQISAPGLTPIRMGDSNQVAPGQVVVAMGFPYGVQGGATLGVVVAPAGELAEQPQRPGQWLAAGLHLRPGHSGGPMVDAEGRLVGINTMMNGPDVGVAVPVQVAKEFLLRVAQAGQQKERERAEAESGVTWV